MAIYLTVGTLIPDRLAERVAIQLTQDDGGDAVNEDLVETFIVSAESIVDAHVGEYYDLDAIHEDPPALLTQLTAQLVIYELHARRPGAATDEISKQYTQAMKQLGDIKAGRLGLGVARRAQETTRRIRSGGTERRFRRTDLAGW